MEKMTLTIGVAPNTENPCMLVLRARGYTLRQWFVRDKEGEHDQHFEAIKEGRRFVGESGEEVLGLIAMWEVRGDDWRTTDDEPEIVDELYPKAITYDQKGRVLGVGDEEVKQPK